MERWIEPFLRARIWGGRSLAVCKSFKCYELVA